MLSVLKLKFLKLSIISAVVVRYPKSYILSLLEENQGREIEFCQCMYMLGIVT
jgi:hypothetical protein